MRVHEMNPGVAPLVIGVVGHRTLPEGERSDEGSIGRRVRAFLTDVIGRHAHAPPLLLTGLAGGADQLVGRIALDLGIDLVACLPMPAERYEAVLARDGSLGDFPALIARAAHVLVVPSTEDHPPGSSEEERGFRDLAVFLAEQANILIALWDGEPARGPGGTGTVVELALADHGLGPRFETTRAEADAYVVHVPVARRSGDPITRREHPRILTLETDAWRLPAETALRALGRYNRGLASLVKDDPGAQAATRKALVGDQHAAAFEPVRGLVDAYAAADALAGRRKGRVTRALREVTALGAVTGILFFLFTDLSHQPWIALLYGIALLGSYAYYVLRVRNPDILDDALDARAVAEALRVALFWNMLGIPQNVASAYIEDPTHEAAPPRMLARNLCLRNALERPTTTPDASSAARCAKDRWIRAERDYFQAASAARFGSARRSAIVERVFEGFALVSSLTLVASTIIRGADRPWEAVEFGGFGLMQFAAGLMMIIVGLLKAYRMTQAYRDEGRAFDRMRRLYARALEAWQRVDRDVSASERPAAHRQIALELGEEALRENLEWLLLHRERPVQVDLP